MIHGSILQQLEAAHRSGSQRSLSLGVYFKNTLVALCHALEDCILDCNSQPLVLTAFQRGKWYLQEADRYRDLAQKSQQVVIMAAPDGGFAEHPTSQLANVDLVPLTPDDPVAAEWHLLIFAPTYTAMVLCQELSEADYGPSGPPSEDIQRKFYGFWTFEPDLVEEVMGYMVNQIKAYNPGLYQQLQQRIATIHQQRQVATPDPLDRIVARVVSYLQASHQPAQSFHTHSSLDDNLISNEVQAFLRMAQIIDQMSADSPNAGMEVAGLTEMMGQLIDLPAWQMKRLRLASLLHRFGPMQGVGSVFTDSPTPQVDDENCPLSCALVPGTQVLRTMSRLRAVAQIITHQTEYWDGSGEPAGLKADNIPLESRILGLAIAVQRQVSCLQRPPEIDQAAWIEQLQLALEQCQQEAGTRWDPKLVDVFTLIVSGLQQGLDLPVQVPKLANGIWLLDSLDAEGVTVPEIEYSYG